MSARSVHRFGLSTSLATRFALALLLLGAGAAGAEMSAAPTILRIERNKNRNAVHYRARMYPDCTLQDPPLEVVWRMLEEDPVVEQPLLPRERPAYGYKVLKLTKYDAKLELRAVPSRELMLRSMRTGNHCAAELTGQIEGRRATVQRVYVYANEDSLVPRVQWIELYGTEVTGQLRERIAK